MLESRVEEHKDTVRNEFAEIAKFLDADIPEPEIKVSWKEKPWYDGYNNRVTINPLAPKYVSKHEARHAAQEATISEISSEFHDELKNFYRSELENLELLWDMGGMADRVNKILPIGSRAEEISEMEDKLGEFGPYETAILVGGKNYLTSKQPEIWASGGYLVPDTIAQVTGGIYFGDEPSEIVDNVEYAARASELWLDTQTNDLGLFSQEVYNQEIGVLLGVSAIHITLNAVAYGGASAALYETLQPEPLKQSNLIHLENEDRKRAMLYNDEVADGIDEFLEVLNEYGIEK